MKQIKAFVTDDGILHTSEEAAERHEIAISFNVDIDKFLLSKESPYAAVPQKSIARQSIIRWELWKKNNATT